jgi:sporulation protein YlmC with PRC-barrel domain
MNTIRDNRTISHILVRAKDVVGVAVKNRDSESLGKIEEIVLDKKTGQTSYVVLSFGGILGLGNKLFALPWHSISYDVDNDCFLLNETKERLENAPGFDKNNWPNMADKAWMESISTYYGKPPS